MPSEFWEEADVLLSANGVLAKAGENVLAAARAEMRLAAARMLGTELADDLESPGVAIPGTAQDEDESELFRSVRRVGRNDASVAEPLARMLAVQRDAEDSLGSTAFVRPVSAQLEMIEGIVLSMRGEARARVLDVAAQWAEFSGWLNTSVQNPREARSWFDRQSEWALEAGNATLVARSLSFKGHLAFLGGQIGQMLGLTEAAQQNSAVWIGQLAYDAHQEARGLAIIGDSEAAVRKVDEGTRLALLADERRDERPAWCYYYTLPFYALERGFVYCFLGRDSVAHNDEAIGLLTSALADMGEARSAEWAGEYICHLASAYLRAGSPDEAYESALEALQIARATDSARLVGRVDGIRVRLATRWPANSYAADLGEALR